MIWVVVFLIIAVGVTTNNSSPFSFTENQFNICVFDEDQTPESQALVAYLGKHHNLVSVKQEQDTILDMLYDERIDYAMTIAKGYAENLQAGKTDTLFTHYYLDDRYANTLLDSTLSEYVKTVLAYETSGLSCMDAISSAETVLSEEISVNSDPFAETANPASHNENFSYYFQYFRVCVNCSTFSYFDCTAKARYSQPYELFLLIFQFADTANAAGQRIICAVYLVDFYGCSTLVQWRHVYRKTLVCDIKQLCIFTGSRSHCDFVVSSSPQ